MVWRSLLPSREETISDNEDNYQKPLYQGLPPQKAGHRMDVAQWVLLDRLAELGSNEPMLPLHQIIFEDVVTERKLGLMRMK